MNASDLARLLSKVNKTSTCWLWTAGRNKGGYGRLRLNGRVELAHRAAWKLMRGAIPDGMMLDHRCHVTACVNPEHLRLATSKQNQENRPGARDGGILRGAVLNKERGRWQARARHNRKTYFAGYHATAEQAAEAARQLRLSLYTHNDPDRKSA